MDKKQIVKNEDGTIVIQSEEVIKNLENQGMQFAEDGSLMLEDGANISISITIST